MSTLNGGPGNIVTEGLVLYLDAANYKSYTSGSTTWRDLTANGYNSTLINGPTFDPSNGGGIVADGTNDYLQTGNVLNFQSTDSFSIFTIFKGISVPGFNPAFVDNTSVIFGKGNTVGSYGIGFNYNGVDGSYTIKIGVRAGNLFTVGAGLPYVTGSIINAGFTYSPGVCKIYTNSQLIDTKINYSVTASGFDVGTFNSFSPNAVPGGNGFYSSGYIYIAQIYNRALSDAEVLQNYNATKTRFGL